MDIAIIGAGHVGQALARGLRALDHTVVFGVPDPAKYAADAAGLGARAATVTEAIGASALVILAVPYAAALEIAAGVADWQGRVLIDATNPIAPGLAGLLVGTTTSGAEQIAARAHGARVVKAFNTTGFENLAAPRYPAGALFLPVAGDDVEARASVLNLARALGFDAVDAGPLASARYTEPAAMLWIDLAYKRGLGRDFGFVREQRVG